MEAFAQPLRQLDEDTKWFARATELALLHVTCSPALRGPAVQGLSKNIEFHLDNRSPVLLLEDAFTQADEGWHVRTQRIRNHWDGVVRVLQEQGLTIAPLPAELPETSDPLGTFGMWLYQVLHSISEPLHGLVVVLAPTQIQDAERFEAQLRELIMTPSLAGVRWAIMDMQEASLDGLHEALGARAMRSACLYDDQQFGQDLGAMMQAMDPQATGPARVGAAWPRGVIPPTRADAVPQPTPEQQQNIDIELAAAGVNAVLAGPQGTRMQQYMLAAAVALKHGDSTLALQHQAEATRIAYEAGAHREALMQHLVLAGYKMGAGREADAITDYTSAAERASEWHCPMEAAQAYLALGLLEARRKQYLVAAAHYVKSARAAQAAQATGLAIEAWRLAGQLAAEAQMPQKSVDYFSEAIALADVAEPDVAKTSSAPQAARQLAAHMRAAGLHEQATSLEHTANRLEEGMTRAVQEVL